MTTFWEFGQKLRNKNQILHWIMEKPMAFIYMIYKTLKALLDTE